MTDYYVAIDLGGTNIRTARCTADGQILARTSHRTQASEGQAAVIDRIIAAVHEVWPSDGGARAIGISAPGPLDPWRGILVNAPNLPAGTMYRSATLSPRVSIPPLGWATTRI